MSRPRTTNRASSASAPTSSARKEPARSEEAKRNSDTSDIVHPTLNRIKKNLQRRLAVRKKKNMFMAGRIKELERCKKYTISMREIQGTVLWRTLRLIEHEEEGLALEKKMKDLEDDCEGLVAKWEGWEREVEGYGSDDTSGEGQKGEVGVEENEEAGKKKKKKRVETEVMHLDNDGQDDHIDRLVEEQHLLGWMEDVL
ncbi:hypothetical protein QBC45DRAFT_435562 [Copromyces sp. CBS 386.78]|nr:hypothetical protein QBC45DRAFT_435562 [Copromyces sp. CBS 386.78]